MTQMFGLLIYNYAFIDKNDTGLLQVRPPNRWASSVYLADRRVLLSQEKFAP